MVELSLADPSELIATCALAMIPKNESRGEIDIT
jgi:hypothetical protein